MSSRTRNSTPTPQVRREEADPQQDQAAQDKATDAAPAARPLRGSCIAPRRTTDKCACLLLCVTTAWLCFMGYSCFEKGDLEQLQLGFDFRGRLCGKDGQGQYLYWCGRDGQQFKNPICIKHCPSGGEKVLCPIKHEDSPEKKVDNADGTVSVSHTTTYHFNKSVARPTKQLLRYYCRPSELEDLPDREWRSSLSPMLYKFTKLFQDFRSVVGLVICGGLVSALGWLLVFRFFARPLILLISIALALCLLGIGAHLVFSDPGFILQQLQTVFGSDNVTEAKTQLDTHISTVVAASSEVATQAARFISPVQGTAEVAYIAALPTLSSLLLAETWLVEFVGSAGPWASICLGSILCFVGFSMLLSIGSRALNVAISAKMEAIDMVFHNPALLMLPSFALFSSCIVVVMAIMGAALLLSTVPVKAAPIGILGQSVEGVYRTFDWSWLLAIQICGLGFALLFTLELVQGMKSFVLQYVSVHWYFGPSKTGLLRNWLILRGFVALLTCHLGSVTIGAFIMAMIRSIHWIVTWLCKQANDQDANRMVRFTLGGIYGLLALVEAFMRQISDNAYAEIVLTSDNFSTASCNAATLLASNAHLCLIGGWLLRPALFVGSCMYSATFGLATFWFLSSQAQVLAGVGLVPQALAGELSIPYNSAVIATAGATVSLFSIWAVASVVDGLASTVLYCFFWDKQDGVLDAERAPPAFKNFLSAATK